MTRGHGTFADPDAWHRPAAYWFWHEPPDPALIRRQVHEMYDAGIRSFQIQARLSYPREGYLDEDFLAACRIAVDTASELGMVVGLYDDYNWQSGHAAGRAVSGHDELRERHLFWIRLAPGSRTGEVSGIRSATQSLGPVAMEWHYEGGNVAWTDWSCEYVVAGGVERAAASVQVDGHVQGCRVTLDPAAPADAEVVVFVSARCATSRLVNPMDPVAVDRFIAAGYEPFARAIGDHFGSTVAYLFFDQPHAVFYDWAERTGQQRSAIPYHRSLGAALREELADDLPRALAALLGGDDADARSLRTRFYDRFSQYAQETFLGRVRDWCHGHGLLVSGHEVLGHVGGWNLDTAFSDWDLRVNFGLDHFGVDGYRDLTAVDAQDAVDQLSPVFGDSVARHHGRSGTLVEQYFLTPPQGGAPWSGHWGLSLRELRATAMTHHLRGMRQMIFHGFYQTHGHGHDHESLANPRFDFPPGINFEPWFAGHHARFAQESARVSEFLEPVRPRTDVAVLYPLRTVWSEGQCAGQARELGQWAAGLSAAGVPFLLIDERDLAAAEAKDGVLRIGDRSFRALVLPATTTLRSSRTMDTLRDLLAAGVPVVTSGPTPEVYEYGPQTAGADWARLGASVSSFDAVPAAAELSGLLPEPAQELSVRAPSDAAVHVRAGTDDLGALRVALFAINGAQVTVSLPPGDWLVEDWEPATGQRHSIGTASTRLTIVLADQEVRLLRLRAAAGAPGPGASGPAHVPSRFEGPSGVAATVLDSGWHLEIPPEAHTSPGTSRPIAVIAGWEQQGLETFAGIADYVREIPASGTPRHLELPAVAGAAEVLVDGVSVGAAGWAPYQFVLPGRPAPGGERCELRVRVAPPAANRYYAGTGLRVGPEPCGLLAPPVLADADTESAVPMDDSGSHHA
ncbi:hypothetical protein [Streptomyces sp. NBC_01361]|uniref:hypothetical protein n=1 Tax=Streptomyces sp. NBC_01361 TaxID=2903838 RepID=UPI002E3535A1|nr:hypothetical protein [Streptomyces sp. NBC_01361]